MMTPVERPPADPASALPAAPAPAAEQQALQDLLARADVQIGGGRPRDLQVHDPRFCRRVLASGSVALGESYMDGWWDCQALDACLCRLLAARLDEQVRSWHLLWNVARAKLLNLQSRRRAPENGQRHYDRGNDLFREMLGPSMIYSCGYWREAATLDEAQQAKLDLICRKLGLEAGDRVLDVGCGWGGFLKYAAEEYGARGVGLTVSKEQACFARAACQGLPVEIRLQDYRAFQEETFDQEEPFGQGAFDHVISVGMFEHVGPKNYAAYFDLALRCLRPGGLFLLETIGAERSSATTNAWINKYIFPGGSAPSARQLTQALEGRFAIEDWHSFGPDYDRTLMAWHERLAGRWAALAGRYDERFRRMWTFYLLGCAGAFRARRNQNWQLVLSPRGVAGGYRSVR